MCLHLLGVCLEVELHFPNNDTVYVFICCSFDLKCPPKAHVLNKHGTPGWAL
jgi:hypothetical protein